MPDLIWVGVEIMKGGTIQSQIFLECFNWRNRGICMRSTNQGVGFWGYVMRYEKKSKAKI